MRSGPRWVRRQGEGGGRAAGQLGIRSQHGFSKWFLLFRSSSYSPHQNPQNLKKKRKKKRERVSPFSPAVPSVERGWQSQPCRGQWFALWTVPLRPRGLRPGRTAHGEVAFPLFPLSVPGTPPFYDLSVILTCHASLFIFLGFHNLQYQKMLCFKHFLE